MALFGITLDEWMEAFSTGGLSLIMGTKKHEHHEHCEHENVKFCSRCDVAYCLGCKKEWGKCNLNHYSLTTWTYPYGTTSASATDPANTHYTISSIPSEVSCTHA